MGFGMQFTAEKFEYFFRHLEEIDDSLLDYANEHKLLLTRNQERFPNRQLHIAGNPEIHIDIYLDEDWSGDALNRLPTTSDSLRHGVGVIGFYQTIGDKGFVNEVMAGRRTGDVYDRRFKRREVVIDACPFGDLKLNLVHFLDKARLLALSWPPPAEAPFDQDETPFLNGWQRTEYWYD